MSNENQVGQEILEIQEQIEEAKNEGLAVYIMFGKVRVNNPDGDDYYYYKD